MDENLREGNGTTIRNILSIAKRNLLLMIIIVAIVIGAGFVYLHFKTPYYTAHEMVVYEGKNVDNSDGVRDYNINYLFIETMVDFMDEGVVVDRANFYYGRYKNKRDVEGEDYTVEKYIESIRVSDDYNGEPVKDKYILKQNIAVEAVLDIAETVEYSFIVKYTDADKEAAEDKVKLLVLAADLESNEKIVIDNVEYYKYFDGVESKFRDYDWIKTESSVSKSRTLILFAVIGAVIAAAVVYVKTITDKTVKEKAELEQLVGQDVLAIIEKTGDR